ncbi:MAG TPA: glycosyltransferase, partial [Myxococcaceae bacterium]
MRARVLIDLRMVSGRLHGIARYALELGRVLPALAPDLVFEGLGPPGGLPSLGPLAPPFTVHAAAAGFLSPLEQPTLAATLRRFNPSLFHATSFSVPLLWRGPLVATLHDAAHLVRGAEFGALTALYYRLVVRPTVRRARGLLTVSDFARRELAGRLGVPEARWTVVPPGVDARFRPPSAEERLAVRARHALPPRYLLAVGNPKPHKNLALLARIAAR